MMMTESQNHDQIDIDAEADLVEEEMDRELAANKDQGYLLPWLVPALIIAAFVAIIILAFLR